MNVALLLFTVNDVNSKDITGFGAFNDYSVQYDTMFRPSLKEDINWGQ